MAIYGKLLSTGELVQMLWRDPLTYQDGSTDVPLVSVPSGFGPFTYNAANQLAVQVPLRKPRRGYAIYADLMALTTLQKTNVWTDLSSGTPKKYLLDTGANTAAIAALDWAVTDAGATGAALTAAKLRIAAAYVQDNPAYLVNPSFDLSINVAGDQLV